MLEISSKQLTKVRDALSRSVSSAGRKALAKKLCRAHALPSLIWKTSSTLENRQSLDHTPGEVSDSWT